MKKVKICIKHMHLAFCTLFHSDTEEETEYESIIFNRRYGNKNEATYR